MKEIKPPLIWRDFAFGFIQDFDLLYDDLDPYVEDFLSSLTGRQKNELLNFIDRLIHSKLSVEDLHEYFFSYDASFSPNEPEKFLAKLRIRLQ